jgi:hypothetical protein
MSFKGMAFDNKFNKNPIISLNLLKGEDERESDTINLASLIKKEKLKVEKGNAIPVTVRGGP